MCQAWLKEESFELFERGSQHHSSETFSLTENCSLYRNLVTHRHVVILHSVCIELRTKVKLESEYELLADFYTNGSEWKVKGVNT